MRLIRLLTASAAALTLAFAAPASAAPVELTDAQLAAAVLLPADVPDAGWTAAAPGTL